jgi:hypothetical protein
MNKNLLKLRLLALAYMLAAIYLAVTATSVVVSLLAYVAFLGCIYFLTLAFVEKAWRAEP